MTDPLIVTVTQEVVGVSTSVDTIKVDMGVGGPQGPQGPAGDLDRASDQTVTGVKDFQEPFRVGRFTMANLRAKTALDGMVAKVSDTVKTLWVAGVRGWYSISGQLVDPVEFGAVGDGVDRPLSDFYGTLAAAQVDYPFVTALTQGVEWAAIQKALNQARYVRLSGKYPIDTPLVIDRGRQMLTGRHPREDYLFPVSRLGDDFVLKLDDNWRNNTEGWDATDPGFATSRSNIILSHFGIIGDRTFATRGLGFIGRNDNIFVDRVHIMYLDGKGLALGSEDAMGLVRESRFTDVFVKGCGNATQPAMILTTGATVADETNQVTFDRLDATNNFGIGVHLLQTKAAAMRRIHFNDLMLHGKNSEATAPAADLMVVEGRIEGLKLDIKANGSHDVGGVKYGLVRFKKNATSGLGPNGVRVELNGNNSDGHGLIVDYCDNLRVEGFVIGIAKEAIFGANCTTTRIYYAVQGTGTRSIDIDPTVTDLLHGQFIDDVRWLAAQKYVDNVKFANGTFIVFLDNGGASRGIVTLSAGNAAVFGHTAMLGRMIGTNCDLRPGNVSQFEVTSGRSWAKGELRVDGALNHDGTTVGFFGVTPATQPAANPDTSGAALAALETEVNELKAALRSLGIIAT